MARNGMLKFMMIILIYRNRLVDAKENKNIIPVTIIEITPEMKKSVQETSQPLFSYFGGFALGAEAVSETIQNNIISEQTN